MTATQSTQQGKTYFGFLNDESGSMSSLQRVAMKDYNANIGVIKDSATRTEQDTIVSMFGFGGAGVTRRVVNSNPHVLKALTSWRASGGTPGREAIKAMIDMFKSLPDANEPHVSFVVFGTTDGEFNGDYYGPGPKTSELGREIKALTATGRWTFVMRVPKGGSRHLDGLNIPAGNIQEWETSEAGMVKSTAATQQAVESFFTSRSAGKTSSTVFYADATAVDTSKLVDVSKRTSLYVVEDHENGHQIRDFILRRRTRYLKGSAFYQLTKTESRVGPNKMLAVRDRTTGAVFAGKEARTMLGLSSVDNIRLHPGNHGNYDLFIQSESVNRKLVAKTGVLYWEEIGVPFTQDEIDRFTGVKAVAVPAPKPAVVVLPQVVPTNRPTPSPLKPTPVSYPVPQPHPAVGGRERFHYPAPGVVFYATRLDAREAANTNRRLKQYDAGPTAAKGKRYFVAGK